MYHNRFVANASGIPPVYKRNLGLEALEHREDGTIEPVVYTRDGLTQLQPIDPLERVEAETFARQSGIETMPSAEGGMAVTAVSEGDFLAVRGVDLGGAAVGFRARVAGQPGGEIEVRLDGVGGPLVARLAVPDTGDLQAWTTVTAAVEGEVSGTRDLYFVFRSAREEGFLAFDWWQLLVEEDVVAGPPAQPFSLRVEADGGGARLTWAGDPEATGYTVRRSLNGDGSYGAVIGEALGTGFVDTDVVSGLTYYYSVSAFNDAGASPFSGLASVALESSLEPLADAYVRGGASADTNFGRDTILAVKTDAADFTRVSLLRFDVSGLGDVAEARLRLVPESGSGETAITELEYRFLAEDVWDEVGVTWNTLPATEGELIDRATGFAIGEPVEIDLTEWARSEAAGDGLLSLAMESVTPGPSRYVAFGSREHAQANLRPALRYAFPAPEAPTGLSAEAQGTAVGLRWKSSEGGQSYLVKRARAEEGPYWVIAFGVMENEFLDTEVEVGERYWYSVAAVGDRSVSADGPAIAAEAPGLAYGDWVEIHFPGETEEAKVGAGSDPDGDRHTNLWEFFMGLDPNVPDGAEAVAASIDDAGNLVLSFRRAEGVVGVSYAVLRSFDLEFWEESPWPIETVSEEGGIARLVARAPLGPSLFQRLSLRMEE